MEYAEFQAVQDKWQTRWKKNSAFKSRVQPNKKKFFITTPYPYISGSLHIGHARVVIEADVYSRFMRMAGYNVLFPQAFHISGTPVLGISLAIQQGDQAKRDLYSSYVRNYIENEEEVQKIVDSFVEPQNIVDFFIPKMQEEFARLGLGVDWDCSFTSGDPMHKALVDWQFRKYKEKEYLVQGKYPILYSLSLQSAVGEDDIAEGDTHPVDKNEFTLLKFGYGDGVIVAATLRPETMYGQTNMWVNPELEYIKANVDGELWYISKECAEKLEHQDHTVTTLETVPGKSFIGKTCVAPVIDKEITILPSKHCDPDIGTGFVTSVPSDAPFDWVMLKALQENEKLCQEYGLNYEEIKTIQPIPIITSKGYGACPGVEIVEKNNISAKDTKRLEQATQEIYKVGFHTGVMNATCGPYKDMAVAKAKDAMRADVLKQNKAILFWETSRKAQSRDGGKVIVSLLDNQWFLDFNKGTWKKDAQAILDALTIVPDKYRKQFEDVFAWLDKRPCARKRGLGTKLPFDKEWVIESLSDSTLYVSLYPIAPLIKEHKLTFEQMNSHFFDFVYLGKGTSGAISDHTGIPVTVLEELRERFQYWYPNDHRHTFNAHLANHLSFLIFAHAAIMPKEYWPKKFSFHGMVLSHGQKMSKSKGNVITLLDVTKNYGVDAFRAFMCNTTSIDATINWQEKEVERLKKHISSLIEILSTMQPQEETELPTNKAFLSKIERYTKEATEALEHMNLRQYTTIVLYNILSAYKKELQRSPDQKNSIDTYLHERWITLLAPIMPHYAEELWEQQGYDGLVSLAEWPSWDTKYIDETEESKEQLMDTLVADIRTVQQLAKLEKIQKITIIVAEPWKYDIFKLLKEQLIETRDVGSIINAVKEASIDTDAPLPKLIPKWIDKLPSVLVLHEEEQMMIQATQSFLEQTFAAEIQIVEEKDSEHAKAAQAIPGKPSILLE